MDLKRKNMVVLFVICGVIFFGQVCVYGKITDVVISPESPTDLDPITITTFGVESSGAVTVSDFDYLIDGNMLELDIYINVGSYQVITPWSYSEDIGTLPVDIYDLTVNVINEYEPSLNDTFSTSFEVVPEPASLLFLAIGMAIVQRKKCDS